jgi:hypothetical protein
MSFAIKRERERQPENFIIGMAKFSQLSDKRRQWLCSVLKRRRRRKNARARKDVEEISRSDVSRWQIYFMAISISLVSPSQQFLSKF